MRAFSTIILLCAALLISGCATSTTPDLNHGEFLYINGKGEAPACVTCHSLEAETFSLGPHMAGVSNRAAAEIAAGQTIEDYLRESILNPNKYLVPGYRNIMYGLYGDHLTEQDINDLIGYILSL